MNGNGMHGNDRRGEDRDEGFDRWLAQQLRAQRPYLDDAGFSERVVAALPQTARSNALLPLLPVAVPVLAALVPAGLLYPGWDALQVQLRTLLDLPLLSLLQVGAAVAWGGALLGVAVLWQSLQVRS